MVRYPLCHSQSESTANECRSTAKDHETNRPVGSFLFQFQCFSSYKQLEVSNKQRLSPHKLIIRNCQSAAIIFITLKNISLICSVHIFSISKVFGFSSCDHGSADQVISD